VIAAVDGPIALTACVEHSVTSCEASGLCPVRGRWDAVNAAILDALSGISLAEMRGRSFMPDPMPHISTKPAPSSAAVTAE
jgi:DNA-binding IscR family transcriptional regulator